MRKTHHIRSRTASRFFKAAKFSEGRLDQMNRLVTLNLSHTSCPEQAASKAVAALVAKFGRWLRYQSKKAKQARRPGFGPPNYGTVLEAPGGICNLHWLVYVPAELELLFEKTLPTWVAKTAGTVVKPVGAIHIEPIDTIMALSRYCMKGVERHHAKRCFVTPVDQGVVWGKRVMISRSLGAKARAKSTRPAPGRRYATGSASPSGSSGPVSPLAATAPVDPASPPF